MSGRLRVLSSAECLERLALGGVGRVSVTDRALPVIVPVLFDCDVTHVTFSTAQGGLLARACDGAVIAFHADDVSAATGAGWSVLVVGVSSVLPRDPTGAGTAAISAAAPDLLVRLPAARVTGQQGQVARPRASGTKVPVSPAEVPTV